MGEGAFYKKPLPRAFLQYSKPQGRPCGCLRTGDGLDNMAR